MVSMLTNAPACRKVIFMAVSEMLLFVLLYIGTSPILFLVLQQPASTHTTSKFFKMLVKIISSLHPNIKNDTFVSTYFDIYFVTVKVSQY